jgi:hypothetical protein
MLRMIAVLILLFPLHAYAQKGSHDGHMMHNGKRSVDTGNGPTARPMQPGQGAFAAIQEIVEILENDPSTDWSKVNIDALRQHLIDMNNVTLNAIVKSEAIAGGMRFTVNGIGLVRDSIRRMVTAHAATMNDVDGWTFAAAQIDDGAILTVRVPAKDTQKLRGLGFLGVMTHGMHHQQHHLMIARGGNPHH